jgi:hypothetical protein
VAVAVENMLVAVEVLVVIAHLLELLVVVHPLNHL